MSRIKFFGIALFLVLAVTFVSRTVLTGGMRAVNLNPAPRFAGLVAQSMGGSKNSPETPIAGKDFNLTNTRNFENSTWVVTDITPLNDSFDPGIVVIHQQNNAYAVVLGPGSDFDSSFLINLPKPVGNYLTTKGVIHESP